MPRLVLMCPPGRGMTSKEVDIIEEKVAAFGLQVIKCETRTRYVMLDGEIDDVRPILDSLPDWSVGILQTSRKL